MTHAGLLHHFKSKNELLVAVLEQRDQDERDASSRSRNVALDDTRGGLAEGLAQLLREHQAAPELMLLWAELTASAARPDHAAHAYFVRRYEHVRAAMGDLLRQRAADGALRDGVDPECAGSLLAAVLDGLQTQWLLDQDLDIIAALDHFLGLVLRPGAPLTRRPPTGSGMPPTAAQGERQEPAL